MDIFKKNPGFDNVSTLNTSLGNLRNGALLHIDQLLYSPFASCDDAVLMLKIQYLQIALKKNEFEKLMT